MGLVDATALVIGCVIGAGIFRTAASIAGHLHTPPLVMAVWVVGGVVSFCGALCYAELGAAYPKTGGDYVYLQKAYGPAVGFLFGWTKVFTERIGTIAILGMVFAEYLGSVGLYGPEGVRWVATGAILALTSANIVGVQVGKGVQNFLTALKMVALLAIILLGLMSGKGALSYLPPAAPWLLEGATWQAFGVALVFVLWTYGGWTESAYVAEEIRNPDRNLPWSILCGLGIVTGLYLAVNWVYLIYIPISEMPGRPLVAAEVMQTVLGPSGARVTSLMVAGSAFGALNGYILTGGRILLALSQDHPVFSRLSGVHPRYATPAKALLFCAAGAMALVWMGTFDQIVTYSTAAISLFFAMGALSVMVLRFKDPQTPRPYRVWGYPATPLIFAAFTGLFVINIIFMQPKETLIGFALTAVGIPLYLWSKKLQATPASLRGTK